MFYGGIALGVVLIARSSAGTPATLTSYLFGAILTTTTGDIVVFAVLAAVVLGTTLLLRPRFVGSFHPLHDPTVLCVFRSQCRRKSGRASRL